MKILVAILLTVMSVSVSYAGFNGSFKVNGDSDKFYPVTFADGAWNNNTPTELYLGRSFVHTDASWLGSLISKFVFHVSLGGHKANFINADIRQSELVFVAGWQDVSINNGYGKIVIWLRGGGVTYYYNSNFEVSPTVYDGVANPLPFNEPSAYNPAGTNHTFKTIVDPYVNQHGISYEKNAYFNGAETNFFAGNVGIGTTDPKGYKLAVYGKIRAQEIKVENTNWPDYVFTKDYQLPTLQETERQIKDKGHLPGIPSAEDVKANGIDLGEMNAKLLQKIEELTLHLIRLEKENEGQSKELKEQKEQIRQLINCK
uniref:hypothetical protein n=1 Tax=Pedobacter schmidteae TaxID=2201271 RepID=UPI000EABCFFD|nr:hypothetical protein [Pedobacter schmidteae]